MTRVLHWIMAAAAPRHGSRPDFDLLQVAFDRLPRGDTTVRRNWSNPPGMYLRVAAANAGLTEVLIQVHRRTVRRRHGSHRGWKLTTVLHDPGHPYHFPEDRTVCVCDWIKLPFVTLDGPGLYATTIYFRAVDFESNDFEQIRNRPWDPDGFGRGWEYGAVDFFRVVKS
jgi:hypothetical protein